MKKRMISLLLAFVMVLGMLPATTLTASAESNYSVWVGGVGMYDGDYLAVGATKTQTTKPSGGYAYYKDGTLTLNNYSYEGEGYLYGSEHGWYATVYAEHDLTLELIGNNTLHQTYSSSDMINVDGANLTVGGDGKLSGTSKGYGLYADKDITINGGTIEVSTFFTSIISYGYGNVIINGGDITAESENHAAIHSSYDITVNGGNVTATGGVRAINYDLFGSFSVAEGMKIQASTTVDGELGEYVAENHNSYKKIVIEPMDNPFTDVPEGSFYYDPVMWALDKNITTGTTPTTFSPLNICNRGQVVTFLWRAAGSPEPTTTVNPFVDVPEGAFYYKAVLWAVENDITTGVDATHFAPNTNCNRGQVVTFLWRAAGRPAPASSENPFVDVPDGAFYHEAVLWAMGSNVTTGVDATHFAPVTECNRAQVVTFLYRVYND